MKVCQALMRIGSRHCHPDAKIADGENPDDHDPG